MSGSARWKIDLYESESRSLGRSTLLFVLHAPHTLLTCRLVHSCRRGGRADAPKCASTVHARAGPNKVRRASIKWNLRHVNHVRFQDLGSRAEIFISIRGPRSSKDFYNGNPFYRFLINRHGTWCDSIGVMRLLMKSSFNQTLRCSWLNRKISYEDFQLRRYRNFTLSKTYFISTITIIIFNRNLNLTITNLMEYISLIKL